MCENVEREARWKQRGRHAAYGEYIPQSIRKRTKVESCRDYNHLSKSEITGSYAPHLHREVRYVVIVYRYDKGIVQTTNNTVRQP